MGTESVEEVVVASQGNPHRSRKEDFYYFSDNRWQFCRVPADIDQSGRAGGAVNPISRIN